MSENSGMTVEQRITEDERAAQQFGARINIDHEVVKGLLFVNGGGAAILLLFLPKVLGNNDFKLLINYIFIAIIFFHLGLVFALIHLRLRRDCSLRFSRKCKYTLWGNKWLNWIFLMGRNEKYLVCQFSGFFTTLSFILFTIGGLTASIGGICSYISTSQPCPSGLCSWVLWF